MSAICFRFFRSLTTVTQEMTASAMMSTATAAGIKTAAQSGRTDASQYTGTNASLTAKTPAAP